MFVVCQIKNCLLNATTAHDTLEKAIKNVIDILEENDVTITDEVREEVNNDYSYLSDDQSWSVCIGIIDN